MTVTQVVDVAELERMPLADQIDEDIKNLWDAVNRIRMLIEDAEIDDVKYYDLWQVMTDISTELKECKYMQLRVIS